MPALKKRTKYTAPDSTKKEKNINNRARCRCGNKQPIVRVGCDLNMCTSCWGLYCYTHNFDRCLSYRVNMICKQRNISLLARRRIVNKASLESLGIPGYDIRDHISKSRRKEGKKSRFMEDVDRILTNDLHRRRGENDNEGEYMGSPTY